MAMDRMALNAAIELLIKGTDDWKTPARFIVEQCVEIPASGSFTFKYTGARLWGKRDSLKGHAAGVGDIEMQTPPEKKVTEFTLGEVIELVGYYKVKRSKWDRIHMQHWRNVDDTTQPDVQKRPPRYCLGFNSTTNEPLYFGVWVDRVLFNFLGLVYIRSKVEQIHGVVPSALRAK